VILHWETLFQEDATGKAMVDIIKGNGMIPGIKVDKGYNKKGIWGTSTGPLGHPEVATLGLDDLQQRCQQAYKDPIPSRINSSIMGEHGGCIIGDQTASLNTVLPMFGASNMGR